MSSASNAKRNFMKVYGICVFGFFLIYFYFMYVCVFIFWAFLLLLFVFFLNSAILDCIGTRFASVFTVFEHNLFSQSLLSLNKMNHIKSLNPTPFM